MSKDLTRSIKLSLASSRTIVECLSFAEMISSVSLVRSLHLFMFTSALNPSCFVPVLNQVVSPQLAQALYIAGLAFVEELKHAAFLPSDDGASSAFLNKLARQNLDMIVKSLATLTRFWAGAGVLLNILRQRASGLGHAGINFETSSDAIPTYVSVPDQGVLRRFTGDLALLPGEFVRFSLVPLAELFSISGLSPSAQLASFSALSSPSVSNAVDLAGFGGGQLRFLSRSRASSYAVGSQQTKTRCKAFSPLTRSTTSSSSPPVSSTPLCFPPCSLLPKLPSSSFLLFRMFSSPQPLLTI